MTCLRSLYVICISGICLGLVPGYPLPDSPGMDVFGQGPVDTDDSGHQVDTLSDSQTSTDSRLERLMRSEIGLKLLRLEGNLAAMLEDQPMSGEADGPLYDTDSAYRDFSKLDDYTGKLYGADQSRFNPSAIFDTDENQKNTFQLAAPVSKRQQGWYIQYGKRSQGTSLPFNRHRDLYAAYNQLHGDNGGMRASPSLDEEDVASNIARLLRNSRVFDEDESVVGAGLGPRFFSSDAEEESEGSDSDQMSTIRTDKRQQGWYTQYGKRSGGSGLQQVHLLRAGHLL